MKAWKKSILLLEVALTGLLFTGCFNYHEIETGTIVAGAALDRGQGGYKYHMTFETLSMSNAKDQATKSVLLESDGDTVFDCLRNVAGITDKRLYFSDCKVVIVSEDLAREGIRPVLDFSIRDHEPRITQRLVVSGEKTAADILKAKLGTAEAVSYHLSEALEENQKVQGHILPYSLYQIYNQISSQSQAFTLPAVRVIPMQDHSALELETNAIFQQDKMIGYMPKEECIYYMMLKSGVQGGILLTGTQPNVKNIALEIKKENSEIKPEVSGNSVTMNIQIQLGVNIGEENDKNKKFTVGNGEFRMTEDAASKTVKKGVEDMISDMQKNYGVDILGFANAIYQKKPNDWKRISKNWNSIFPKVKCNVTADVKIYSSGTIVPKGGE